MGFRDDMWIDMKLMNHCIKSSHFFPIMCNFSLKSCYFRESKLSEKQNPHLFVKNETLELQLIHVV